MAIAQAVLEYLDTLGARTLFATHYHELTAFASSQGGELKKVSCLTIDVREHNNEIIFMHRIIPGVASRSYGIHVAKMAGMPESVVARAEEVLSGLEHGGPKTVDTASRQNETKPKKSVDSKVAPMVHEPESARSQLSLFD